MLELTRYEELALAVYESSSIDHVAIDSRAGFPFWDTGSFIIKTQTGEFNKETSFELVGTTEMEMEADLIFRLPADNDDFPASGSEALTDEVYDILHHVSGYLHIELLQDTLRYTETGDENMIIYTSRWKYVHKQFLFQDEDSLRLKWRHIHKKWNELNEKWNDVGPILYP